MDAVLIVLACFALFILVCINGNLARLVTHHERFPAPLPEQPPTAPEPPGITEVPEPTEL